MTDKRNPEERLERLMNHLAEAVLGLSDEAILADTNESGSDPEQAAERTRSVLRQASAVFDSVNKRLSDLGHTINSNDWCRGVSGYHNTCQTCGSFVSFTTATGQIQGENSDGRCSGRDQYTIRRIGSTG